MINNQVIRGDFVLFLVVTATVLHGHPFIGTAPKGQRGLAGVKERERTPGESVGQVAIELAESNVEIEKSANPTDESVDQAKQPSAGHSAPNERAPSIHHGRPFSGLRLQRDADEFKEKDISPEEECSQDAVEIATRTDESIRKTDHQSDRPVPSFSTPEELDNATRSAEAQKEQRKNDVQEIGKALSTMKETVNVTFASCTTAVTYRKHYNELAKKSYNEWKNPSSIIKPLEDALNTANQDVQQKNATYMEQKNTKDLVAAIRQFDDSISLADFKIKFMTLEGESSKVQDLIDELDQKKLVRPSPENAQCLVDLEKAQNKLQLLKSIEKLLKNDDTSSVKTAVREQKKAQIKLNEASNQTYLWSVYVTHSTDLNESKVHADNAKENLTQALSTLQTKKEQKEEAEMEIARLDREMTAYEEQKKTLTTPAATITSQAASEGIASSTDKSVAKAEEAVDWSPKGWRFWASIVAGLFTVVMACGAIYGLYRLGKWCTKKKPKVKTTEEECIFKYPEVATQPCSDPAMGPPNTAAAPADKEAATQKDADKEKEAVTQEKKAVTQEKESVTQHDTTIVQSITQNDADATVYHPMGTKQESEMHLDTTGMETVCAQRTELDVVHTQQGTEHDETGTGTGIGVGQANTVTISVANSTAATAATAAGNTSQEITKDKAATTNTSAATSGAGTNTTPIVDSIKKSKEADKATSAAGRVQKNNSAKVPSKEKAAETKASTSAVSSNTVPNTGTAGAPTTSGFAGIANETQVVPKDPPKDKKAETKP